MKITKLAQDFFTIDAKDAVSKLIRLVLITGFIASVFIKPLSGEHVELAQTLAGQIPVSEYNEFYQIRQTSPTIQLVLPALMLRAGITAKSLGLASSFFSQTLSFLALSLLIFYFTQNLAFSFLSLLILLPSTSPSYHFYPFIFPSSYASFGNFANWWALLIVALYLNNFKKIAYFCLGLCVSIHLLWFIAALIFIGYLSKNLRQVTKQQLGLFGVGLAISLLAFWANREMMRDYFMPSIYLGPGSAGPIVLKVLNPENARPFFGPHYPNLTSDNSMNNIRNFFNLNLYSLLFFGLCLINGFWKIVEKDKVNNFFRPYLLIYAFTISSLIAFNLNDRFEFFPNLHVIYMRFIANRFLNLSYLLTHLILLVSLFAYFQQARQTKLKLLTFGIALYFIRKPYDHAPFAVLLFFGLLVFDQYYDRIFGSRVAWKE